MEDIKELVRDASLPVEALIGHEPDRELVHVIKCGKRDNGRWFDVAAAVGKEWLDPYFEHLNKLTGYVGDMPEMDAPRFESDRWRYMTPQCVVTGARMSRTGYSRTGFVSTSDWQGRKAENRAQPYFLEILKDDIGYKPTVEQYIPINEWGTEFRLNPNWGKHIPPRPCKDPDRFAETYWRFIFNWWWESRATPEQREFLKAVEKNHRTVCQREHLADYLRRPLYGPLMVSYGNNDRNLTLEQFKVLGRK